MSDPFRIAAYQKRLVTLGLVILLALASLAIGYLRFGTINIGGKPAMVEVVRVGTRPVSRVAGGTAPVVTVRMPDGSIRQVEATWGDVDNCVPGRWLSVHESAAALQVGQPGCSVRE